MKNYEFWQKIGENLQNGPEEFAGKNNLPLKSALAASIAESFNNSFFSEVAIAEKNNEKCLEYKHASLRWLQELRKSKKVASLFFLMFIFAGWILYQSVTHFLAEEEWSRIVAARRGGLPQFEKISAGDSASKVVFWGNLAGSPDVFEGRYTLSERVPEGEPIPQSNLLSRDLSAKMPGRMITAIPVKNEYVSEFIKPNTAVSIAFTGKDLPTNISYMINDVILLDTKKNDISTTLTIAVSSHQLEQIQKFIAVSEPIIIK